ncbi:LysM peptidoglycan-binding domain-containing protein [Paenibacillus sp. GCM10027627]|uniref:LysM peptidoglycan-binding domain-containing protein n=1 Tax=unclassified Paenibacillus TaxID=185978 RepID=UPI00363803CA
MSNGSNGLRFDVYERVHLPDDVAGIDELEEIELVPRIQVIDQGEQAILKGQLLLSGVYRGQDGGDGPLALEHWIPVEISLPMNRVSRLDDISIEIDNFDVDLISARTLNITGVLSLRGISVEPVEDQAPQWGDESFTAVHQRELYEQLQNEGAEYANPLNEAFQSEQIPSFPAYHDALAPDRNADATGLQPQQFYIAEESGPADDEVGEEREITAASSGQYADSWLQWNGAQPPPSFAGGQEGGPFAGQDGFYQQFHIPAYPQAAFPPPSGDREAGLQPLDHTTGFQSQQDHLSAFQTQQNQGAPIQSQQQGWGAAEHSEQEWYSSREQLESSYNQEPDQTEYIQRPEEEEAEWEAAEQQPETDQELEREPILEAIEAEQAEEALAKKPQEVQIAFTGKSVGSGDEAGSDVSFKTLLQSSKREQAARQAAEETISKQQADAARNQAGEEEIEWKKLFLSKQADDQEFRKIRVCIVQREETLEQIALRYSLNPRELLVHNGLHESAVAEGQLLYIP